MHGACVRVCMCVRVKANLKCRKRSCEDLENSIPGRWPHHRRFVSRGWSWCSVMFGPCKIPERGNKPSEIKRRKAITLLWGQPHLSRYIEMQIHVRPPREKHQLLGSFNSGSGEAPVVTWWDAWQCPPLPAWGNHAVHIFGKVAWYLLSSGRKKLTGFNVLFPLFIPWIKHVLDKHFIITLHFQGQVGWFCPCHLRNT